MGTTQGSRSRMAGLLDSAESPHERTPDVTMDDSMLEELCQSLAMHQPSVRPSPAPPASLEPMLAVNPSGLPAQRRTSHPHECLAILSARNLIANEPQDGSATHSSCRASPPLSLAAAPRSPLHSAVPAPGGEPAGAGTSPHSSSSRQPYLALPLDLHAAAANGPTSAPAGWASGEQRPPAAAAAAWNATLAPPGEFTTSAMLLSLYAEPGPGSSSSACCSGPSGFGSASAPAAAYAQRFVRQASPMPLTAAGLLTAPAGGASAELPHAPVHTAPGAWGGGGSGVASPGGLPQSSASQLGSHESASYLASTFSSVSCSLSGAISNSPLAQLGLASGSMGLASAPCTASLSAGELPPSAAAALGVTLGLPRVEPLAVQPLTLGPGQALLNLLPLSATQLMPPAPPPAAAQQLMGADFSIVQPFAPLDLPMGAAFGSAYNIDSAEAEALLVAGDSVNEVQDERLHAPEGGGGRLGSRLGASSLGAAAAAAAAARAPSPKREAPDAAGALGAILASRGSGGPVDVLGAHGAAASLAPGGSRRTRRTPPRTLSTSGEIEAAFDEEAGGEGGAAGDGDPGSSLQLLAMRFRARPGRVPKAVTKLGPIAELAKNAAAGRVKLDKEELDELVSTVESSLARSEKEQKEDSRARNRVAQQRFRNRQRETIAALQAKVEEQDELIAELEAKIRFLESNQQQQQQQQGHWAQQQQQQQQHDEAVRLQHGRATRHKRVGSNE